MTGIMDAIKGRRSIRRYLDKSIPGDHLTQVLEAMRWSPSWANTQCWEAIIIKDPGIKQQLQQTIPDFNPAKQGFMGAPVIIAVCAKLKVSGYLKGDPKTKFGDWFMFDLGASIQNLSLAAHDLGLGSVIVTVFGNDEARGILKVPEGYELIALVPIGYPEEAVGIMSRRRVKEFTHYDVF